MAKSKTEGPAPVGHNVPPPTPETYEAIKAHIDDLYDEAKNWLDGDAISTQAQADEVSRLLGMIREAEQLAEKERRRENEVFDKGKAEVQARYAPLTADTKTVRGKTVLATEACKAALRPWLMQREAERQAAADAARKEAERIAEAARVQAAAADPANLQQAEQIEAMFDDAQQAAKAVAAIERERPNAGGGEYRATGLRTIWIARVTDATLLLRHYWQTRRADLESYALTLAQAEVRSGKRAIPGVEVVADKVAA